MVDIFKESPGALVRPRRAVTIEPARLSPSAPCFVTIFAAEAFDPRLMRDAAARNPIACCRRTRASRHRGGGRRQLRAKAKPSLSVCTWRRSPRGS